MVVTASAPLIVEVARYRLEDGPGIRSVVFFKGCGLRCSFCHNPEAQEFHAEVVRAEQRCILCGACAGACVSGAIRPSSPGHIERDACTRCGACADACPAGGLRRIGTSQSPEALAEVLLRDRHFYLVSGGGVTLSGGEPVLFPHYLAELLPRLGSQGVHVLLETGGHFADYDVFRSLVLPHLDAVDFSLKLVDPDAHRVMAGQDNELILRNLRLLAAEPRVKLTVSIPIVPGVTDTNANLEAAAELLRELGVATVRLLPYNPLGAQMAVSRGRPAPPLPRSFMTPAEYERVVARFREYVAPAR
jgi:pyruvate formate lyase activating enzyme